jgi:hypothetical protein
VTPPVPPEVMEEFLSDGVRCRECHTLLSLKPIFEKAILEANREMVAKGETTASPASKMPFLIICQVCKDEGHSTLICIRN